MTKKKAEERRKTIRTIILESGHKGWRSVDDWYRIVGKAWPDGWNDAPAKNTVKKELYEICHDQLMDWRFHVRGWFQQERFWIIQTVQK